MINATNSYLSYKTLQMQNIEKKQNSNLNQTNSNQYQNLVSDKSQAVSQVLGYGVDKEGFFTSDFNEAAGLPKDYKIYAKGAENLVNFETSLKTNPTGRAFVSIDLAKSVNRAYQVFSQLIGKIEGNFSKEDLDKIPQWFEYNTQSLQVSKIYTKDEYLNITPSKESAYSLLKHSLSFPSYHKLSLDFVDKNEDIFSSHHVDIGKSFYTHADESISKGGVLMAFFAYNGDFLRGQTTVFGKMLGLDDDFGIQERKELDEFIKNNPIAYTLSEDIGAEILKRFTLRSAYTDVEEFKNEWQKLKAESDKAYAIIQNEKLNNTNAFSINDEISQNEEDKKVFTPIQAKSSSQTYGGVDTNELLKQLLESKFNEKDFLKMLFGESLDDKEFKDINFSALVSRLNLKNIYQSVDLKV